MAHTGKDNRSERRSFVEPYDTRTFLEFTIGETRHRFSLLDTSPGGMGMLVENGEEHILEKLEMGERIKMKYGQPGISTVDFNFEIKHITSIRRGSFKGHYQVGLSLVTDPE